MKALLRPIFAALALVLCAGFGIPSHRITYTLTPVLEDGALSAVEVDLSFRGQGDGETALRLPDAWGGEEELWRHIDGLQVLGGAEMRDGANEHERILTHAPNARIRIRYRIVHGYDGPPPAGRNTYRPVIQPTYFHFIGEGALALPDLHYATPARLRTRSMPHGWLFASDLQHAGLTLGHVAASVTVGGDYRILRADDANIRVAIRGDWNFADEAFTRQVGQIISGHRAFWGDASTPYLVTVTQTFSPDAGHISVGGTGLSDAFAFFATSNADDAPITRTLAHESFHTWIPGRVGGMPEEGEAAHYWFSEGFTDFYTGRMLVREGLWTPQQFANDLNDTLVRYAASPVRDAPNTRILADFWRDYDVQQLPYQRGRLLATIWDARLRAEGRSLDHVMRRMGERADDADDKQATQLLQQAMNESGLDIGPDVATYAENGVRIVLPEDAFSPCGRVISREVAIFDRGFDVAALQTNNNVISGVDRQSPAYAAGLRDGMVLIRREGGRIGDSEQLLTYIVRDGEQERTISYYPRGHGTLVTQRLEIDPSLDGERLAQCRAVIGGGEAHAG